MGAGAGSGAGGGCGATYTVGAGTGGGGWFLSSIDVQPVTIKTTSGDVSNIRLISFLIIFTSPYPLFEGTHYIISSFYYGIFLSRVCSLPNKSGLLLPMS
jgi:hypothetical protein